MAGIKETLELFAAIKSLLEAYKLAMADGKITIFDARYLAAPISAVKVGLQGLKEIPVEVADLDKDELEAVINAAVELVTVALEAAELPAA